jgi:two-component system, cell cycle response regulator DivK
VKSASKKDNIIPDWSDKSILLAEDENINVLFIKAALESSGVKIFFAKNGLEAVEICKNQNSLDLVLMDIKMPEMNGFDATRIIKSFDKYLPVVAITAYTLKSDWEKCMEAGCDGYLPKPIIFNDLMTVIKKYLN